MATHSSMLACKIPRTEMPGGLQSMGSKESDTTERLSMHTSLLMKGKILVKMKKCDAIHTRSRVNKQNIYKNTMNERLERQVLRYNPQNKISRLQSIAMIYTY